MSLAPAQVTLHKLARRDHEVEASLCPIRAPHRRYRRFSEYGDAAGYRARGAAGASKRRTG